ncbi:MAG: N-acetylglucosamine-6-phosphate deacetylase [Fusobacteriaceae bacterium]
MIAITNGKIFNGIDFSSDKTLIIKEDKILNIINSKDLLLKYPNVSIYDAENSYITPGFIDLQLNGCGGVLFNQSISRETLEIMNKTNLKYGCTSFTPTLITTSDENIRAALDLIDSLEDKESIGVLGLHIEGPFISFEKKGVHNPKFIRTMDDAILDRIIHTGKKGVKIITVAPENMKGEHISSLANSGIKVALGHTNATYEEIVDKKIYGITLATHLYNGMSSFTHRAPGAMGATMNLDICAGIIADGFHCHYAALEMAHKLMGDRLYLVTDAAAPAGTDIKEFDFEGTKVFHENGKLFTAEGTLGGSALTMIAGVVNLVNNCKMSFEEAVRMATIYPAKAISIDNEYGKLQPGYFADINIIDKDLKLKQVISKGKLV